MLSYELNDMRIVESNLNCSVNAEYHVIHTLKIPQNSDVPKLAIGHKRCKCSGLGESLLSSKLSATRNQKRFGTKFGAKNEVL